MSNLYLYIMCSRNKDNKNIPGFKKRFKAILEYKENERSIIEEFVKFANDGVLGEKTRLYRSVNSRNEDKIREELIVRLLKQKPSGTKLNRVLASVAKQIENRDESKWLFDFDEDNEALLDEFICDIPVDTQSYKTPHGYAVVCEHGFDTRKLLNKWKEYNITLKKDGLLFLDILEKR